MLSVFYWHDVVSLIFRNIEHLYLGFTQQLQSLQHLVNAAVASGARWFIEPIFKSSAGRMLLHSYKESSQLPEVIARKNGHEETANFLADITKR